jgi:hypothetical protein
VFASLIISKVVISFSLFSNVEQLQGILCQIFYFPLSVLKFLGCSTQNHLKELSWVLEIIVNDVEEPGVIAKVLEQVS